MELPLDLVPLIVNAADCTTAATLARVCKTAYTAVDAKYDAIVVYGTVYYDGLMLWLRGCMYVHDPAANVMSVYHIISYPELSIEYVSELSTGKLTPPKSLVSKYYAIMSQKKD